MNVKTLEVLLVDDCEEDVDLMQKALRDYDFHAKLDVAYNGEEALKRLDVREDEYPDLILLDLNMPRINGHQVLARIKSHETLKKIPVVILTTSRSPDDVNRCYNNYGNCYVCKPLDFESYREVVGKIKEFWLDLARLPTVARRSL